MSIVVFGATGLTGKEAVWQALAKGEDVVAFCRNSAGLTKPAGSCGEAAAEQPIADDKLVTVTGRRRPRRRPTSTRRSRPRRAR